MRFSKQREAVYEVLSRTNSHPDVAWIYENVKKVIPNVSIATVYRNLNELQYLGRIKKVSVENYAERYDADVSDHAHLVCERCGVIEDINADKFGIDYNLSGVTRCEVTFYGLCDECRKITKGEN